MKLKSLFLVAGTAAALLLGPSLAASPQPKAEPASAAAAPAPVQARPALWKLADHDTTIFLFGTVHILPEGIDWYHGPVAYAFSHSDLLVTELPEVSQGELVQGMLKYGVLPAGQSLRSKMGDERRGRYEAGLTGLGQSPAMFDRNKAWVPALLIPLLAVQKFGYDPRHGVEASLETLRAARAGAAAQGSGKAMERIGLETVDFQFGLFNMLDEEQQLEYLDSVVVGIPEMKDTIDAMVAAWSRGDTDRLAALMNSDDGDPAIADALLYSRNRTWTKWIANRMKQPGTVFVAVGTGHLGGKKSVIELLGKQGYRVTRVQ